MAPNATSKPPSPSHELALIAQHAWHTEPLVVIAFGVILVLSAVVNQWPRRRRRRSL